MPNEEQEVAHYTKFSIFQQGLFFSINGRKMFVFLFDSYVLIGQLLSHDYLSYFHMHFLHAFP